MSGSTQRILHNSSHKTKEPISTSQTVLMPKMMRFTSNRFLVLKSSTKLWKKNTDPVIEKMALALKTKATQEVADGVEAEKRGRSIVITGLSELGANRSLKERQRDLEEKVANVPDALEVDCLPEVAYKLGTFNGNKPCPVKVILPSRSHWAKALLRAQLLRRTNLSNIFLRKKHDRGRTKTGL
ncbi:hypothetical protein RB195_024532 [Necator americanus]